MTNILLSPLPLLARQRRQVVFLALALMAVLVGAVLLAMSLSSAGASESEKPTGSSKVLTTLSRGTEGKPSVQIVGPSGAGPVVPAKRGTVVLITGAGYEPGQSLKLMTVWSGVPSDISFVISPKEPVANETGAFAVMWNFGWAGHKAFDINLATEVGVYDAKTGKMLASTAILLCDPTAEAPAPWCKVVPEPSS